MYSAAALCSDRHLCSALQSTDTKSVLAWKGQLCIFKHLQKYMSGIYSDEKEGRTGDFGIFCCALCVCLRRINSSIKPYSKYPFYKGRSGSAMQPCHRSPGETKGNSSGRPLDLTCHQVSNNKTENSRLEFQSQIPCLPPRLASSPTSGPWAWDPTSETLSPPLQVSPLSCWLVCHPPLPQCQAGTAQNF